MSEVTTKRRRGKGKTPALVHVNVRLPAEVLDFYKRNYPSYTGGMREVLCLHASEVLNQQKEQS